MDITLHPSSYLVGNPKIPGDKSVSHRSLLFGALAGGESIISNLLESGDVYSTWKCLSSLGVRISKKGDQVHVEGRALRGLGKPESDLDCGNSGTTMRLLMGVLSGYPFLTRLVGDESLSRRPMKRIAHPLLKMGAKIELTDGELAPLLIQGTTELQPIHYELPVASAQLKSSLLLAGLFAQGETVLSGRIQSRDHTERLLPHFGVKLGISKDQISIQGGQKLHAAQVQVPGDLSSAAFWIAAAVLIPGANLQLENVSLNPSRLGILNILERMGAVIEREITTLHPEPIGRLRITSSRLQGISIVSSEIPTLVDELPLIAVLATFAEGITQIQGAEELRVKETDRIEAIARNLRTMGVEIDTFNDGFSIRGPQTLKGGKVNSYGDHRIAMAFSIAALRATGPTEIQGIECVSISYPTFYETLKSLTTRGV